MRLLLPLAGYCLTGYHPRRIDLFPPLPRENYTMDNRLLLEYVWALFVASNYQKLEVPQSAHLLLLLSIVRLAFHLGLVSYNQCIYPKYWLKVNDHISRSI